MRTSGLGYEFFEELETAFRNIESNPDGQPLLESNETDDPQFRRCLLKRFPYLVIFTIRPEEILILAVAHAQRKPSYWRNRLP